MTRFFVFSDLHYAHVFDADKRLQMIRKAVEDSDVDFAITLFAKAQGLHIPEDGKPYEIKGVIGMSASSEIDVCLREPLPPFFEKRPTACLFGVETEDECFAVASKASCTTYVSSDIKLPPCFTIPSRGGSYRKC